LFDQGAFADLADGGDGSGCTADSLLEPRALGCGVGAVWAKLAAISGPMAMTRFAGAGRHGIETRGKVLEEWEA